jgi:hypothetical protein
VPRGSYLIVTAGMGILGVGWVVGGTAILA